MEVNKIKEYERELRQVLDKFYFPARYLAWLLMAIALIVSGVLVVTMGELVYILIVVAVFIISKVLGLKLTTENPTEKEVAYTVCVLMEKLTKLKDDTYPGTKKEISTIGEGNHIQAYEKFILFYPQWKCFKLWYLSQVKLTFNDFM